MFFKGFLVLLAMPLVVIVADDAVTPTQSGILIPRPPAGLSAPFEVDVTTLFTNKLSEMTYVALTNLLEETRAELKETGHTIPEKRAAARDAKTKAMRENPAVQEIRKQVEALKLKAEVLIEEDPGCKAAADALRAAQQDIMILSKKSQLLSKEVWDREQQPQASAAETVTNTP